MAEARDWRVAPTKKGYFKMFCPCADKHLKMVAKTPSGANYGKNLLSWLQRLDCWEEDA